MSSQEVNSRCEAIYNGFDCTRQDVFAVECLRNGYMQVSDLFAYCTEIAVFLILTVISVEKRRLRM